MFECDCCGLCCMQVSESPLYSDLDRGDGICSFFDCKTKLCTIYDHRPIRCDVDKTYELFFKNQMSKESYYSLNYEGCLKLKKVGGK